MLIKRRLHSYAREIFQKYPIVTVTGPRQSGKTTLVKDIFADKPYANLERPDVRLFAQDDPLGFLAQFPDGAVLDEVQRVPELLSYLQVQVDEDGRTGLFVLTGSHQFELMQGISQSLSGRTALLKLLPFALVELEEHFPLESVDTFLYKGFYPRIYDHDLPPTQALSDYYATYIERDLRQLLRVKDLSLFDRFVRLCAGRVGQLLNVDSLANDVGVAHTTAREWLTILEASFIVFLLPPYHTTTSKRLIKSPKLYFYDVGLATYLCGIEDEKQLQTYPLRGNFFENAIVLEILKHRLNQGKDPNLCFYRDSTGNEVDVLYPVGPDRLVPIEIKSGQTINSNYFKSLKAYERFFGKLEQGAAVVYGGREGQQRSDVTVVPWHNLSDFLNALDNG
ncbi:MAG: ATP-binding protein [Candidatus Latescibacteria bacterium]|jgi:uncharacterized protein|nr:ATP-binding protein [Candidatus Latescibacterota bacterium]